MWTTALNALKLASTKCMKCVYQLDKMLSPGIQLYDKHIINRKEN